MEKNGIIVLTAEDGSEEAFFVVEKAELAGKEYLLVTDQEISEDEEQDVTALILRVNREKDDGTIYYDVVEDEKEQTILSKYFEELVEDIQIAVD